MSAESSEDVARPGEHRVRSQEVGSHLESADIPAAALFVMIELLEPAAWRRGAMPRVRSPSDSRGLVLRIAAHVWFGAMPRYRASLSSVEKRVPRGAVLPDTLTQLLALCREPDALGGDLLELVADAREVRSALVRGDELVGELLGAALGLG